MSATERLYLPSDDLRIQEGNTGKTILIISGTAIGLVVLIALVVMWNQTRSRTRSNQMRYLQGRNLQKDRKTKK